MFLRIIMSTSDRIRFIFLTKIRVGNPAINMTAKLFLAFLNTIQPIINVLNFRAGYVVIFLYRDKSLKPFSRSVHC